MELGLISTKSDYQIQFPYYIRRAIYFIDRYFLFKKPGRLLRELRSIKTKKKTIKEESLKPFLKNPNFNETEEKRILDIFFNNMLNLYTIGRICEAFQNLDRYIDLDYPKNFKLLKGCTDYLFKTRLDGYELLQ